MNQTTLPIYSLLVNDVFVVHPARHKHLITNNASDAPPKLSRRGVALIMIVLAIVFVPISINVLGHFIDIPWVVRPDPLMLLTAVVLYSVAVILFFEFRRQGRIRTQGQPVEGVLNRVTAKYQTGEDTYWDMTAWWGFMSPSGQWIEHRDKVSRHDLLQIYGGPHRGLISIDKADKTLLEAKVERDFAELILVRKPKVKVLYVNDDLFRVL